MRLSCHDRMCGADDCPACRPDTNPPLPQRAGPEPDDEDEGYRDTDEDLLTASRVDAIMRRQR